MKSQGEVERVQRGRLGEEVMRLDQLLCNVQDLFLRHIESVREMGRQEP